MVYKQGLSHVNLQSGAYKTRFRLKHVTILKGIVYCTATHFLCEDGSCLELSHCTTVGTPEDLRSLDTRL